MFTGSLGGFCPQVLVCVPREELCFLPGTSEAVDRGGSRSRAREEFLRWLEQFAYGFRGAIGERRGRIEWSLVSSTVASVMQPENISAPKISQYDLKPFMIYPPINRLVLLSQ